MSIFLNDNKVDNIIIWNKLAFCAQHSRFFVLIFTATQITHLKQRRVRPSMLLLGQHMCWKSLGLLFTSHFIGMHFCLFVCFLVLWSLGRTCFLALQYVVWPLEENHSTAILHFLYTGLAIHPYVWHSPKRAAVFVVIGQLFTAWIKQPARGWWCLAHIKKQNKKTSAVTLQWFKLNCDETVLLSDKKYSLLSYNCQLLCFSSRSRVWVSSSSVLYCSNPRSLDIPSELSQLQMLDPTISCINGFRMGRINKTLVQGLHLAHTVLWAGHPGQLYEDRVTVLLGNNV